MTVQGILCQFHVVQILAEQEATQFDLANLLSCSTAFLDSRKNAFQNLFTVRLFDKISYLKALNFGVTRVYLAGLWILNHKFDFSKNEKQLTYFSCYNFNQPVESFGSLKTFRCAKFNQPVTSFNILRHFRAMEFNQPVKSFDLLTVFECFGFNQPIASFDSLIKFDCFMFNQPVKSFDYCALC